MKAFLRKVFKYPYLPRYSDWETEKLEEEIQGLRGLYRGLEMGGQSHPWTLPDHLDTAS